MAVPKAGAKKSKKAVNKTDTFYDAPKWPTLDSSDADVMLQMLCQLLRPIGHHRRTYAPPSKVARNRKRKRINDTPTITTDLLHSTPAPPPEPAHSEPPPPPLPAISLHITVGVNGITKALESSIESSKHSASPDDDSSKPKTDISIIFIPTSTPQSTIPLQFQHLPNLAYLASQSRAHPPSPTSKIVTTTTKSFSSTSTTRELTNPPKQPSAPPILLIPLPSTSHTLLPQSLAIPRVSAIALHQASPGVADGVTDLIAICRSKVSPVDIGWWKIAFDSSYAEAGQWSGVRIGVEGGG